MFALDISLNSIANLYINSNVVPIHWHTHELEFGERQHQVVQYDRYLRVGRSSVKPYFDLDLSCAMCNKSVAQYGGR